MVLFINFPTFRECHYPHYQAAAFTSRIIQKVRSLRRGEGKVIEKRTKTNRERRKVLASAYVRLFLKKAEIFKMKFYSYFPVFPIDYNGSMKYETNYHERL